MFLCLPIVCETLPVSLCFLSCSVLSPLIYGVKFCGRIPVSRRYSLLDLPILLILGCGLCWLCVCLWLLVLVGSFVGRSFPPAGYLRVSLSPTSSLLFCGCEQVVLELVLPCLQGFEAFLLLLFSCLFLVITSLFNCISR